MPENLVFAMPVRKSPSVSVQAGLENTLLDRALRQFVKHLHKFVSENCKRWLACRDRVERPVPPFALERLSARRRADGRIAQARYVVPRHRAANCVGPGRGRWSTRPGVNGVVELSPFEFLDRLTDLVPPPRKHRHRYHGVFAPNQKLKPAVTALAIGNGGK
jgi:hypothetical protein